MIAPFTAEAMRDELVRRGIPTTLARYDQGGSRSYDDLVLGTGMVVLLSDGNYAVGASVKDGPRGWAYREGKNLVPIEQFLAALDAAGYRAPPLPPRDETLEALRDLESVLEQRVPLPAMPSNLSPDEKQMLLLAMQTGAELVIKFLRSLSEDEKAKAGAITGNYGLDHQRVMMHAGRAALLEQAAQAAESGVETSLAAIRQAEGIA